MSGLDKRLVLFNSYGSQVSLGENLAHSSVGLVYGDVGVSVAVGIRIGDFDSAKRFSPDHTGTFRIRSVERFKQRVIFVSAPVRPAVYGNRLNVPRGIEIGGRKHARELITDISLKGLERSGQEVGAPGPVLILAIQARTAGRSNKMEETGFLRRAGKLVVSHGNGKIERKGREIAAG